MTRNIADDQNANPSFDQFYWATLSPLFRAVHNRLRRARGLPAIPEPKVDLYKPPRGTVRPFDPADPDAAVAAADFLGPAEFAGSGIEWRLALELARTQLRDRDLHTNVLHRAIVDFFDLAMEERERLLTMKESALNKSERALRKKWRYRKGVLADAAKLYDVCESSVEKALAERNGHSADRRV
jgi:hypothetical protein